MKEVFQVRENIKSSDNQRKLFFSFGCDSLRIRSGRETVSVLHPSYVSALWKVIFPAISRKGYLPLHKALSGKQTGFWLLLGFLLVFFFEELFCQGIRKSSSLQSMSFTTLFFFSLSTFPFVPFNHRFPCSFIEWTFTKDDNTRNKAKECCLPVLLIFEQLPLRQRLVSTRFD